VKSGNTVDFQSRTIPTTRHEYFPLDFEKTNSSEPSFYVQPGQSSACEALFHFNSVHILGMPPSNMLAIRVTILRDSTFLGFRVPHFLADSQSMCNILEAYTDILAGKSIPRIAAPPDVDVPASTFIKNTPINLPQGLKLHDIPFLHTKDVLGLGIFQFLSFFVYYLHKMIMGKIFESSKPVEKYIHLPKGLVAEWRAEAQRELISKDSE